MEGFSVDWTGRYRGHPSCVVRVRDVDGVVTVMQRSRELGFAVVPQGGNTGLVGGTMAPPGSVILSLAALRDMGDVDDHSVVVGAGRTIADVHTAARAAGLTFGLDLASRGTATVGGTLATNAEGLYACHWGRMRDQVEAVDFVLADGTSVSTRGRVPTVPGPQPLDLLAGAEGTLAVTTAVRLRLRDQIGPSTVVLAGFDTPTAALGVVEGADRVLAAELFRHAEMAVVASHCGLAMPLGEHPWYLLFEVVDEALESVAVPDNAVVGAGLWSYRERITESLAQLGTAHKFDVVVPPDSLGALVARLETRIAPDRLFVFGHLLMHDIHLNVLPAHPGAAVARGIDDIVLDAVEAAGGSIAGEHGVGRAKGDRLRRSLSGGRLTVIDMVKDAFDPDRRLNPGAGVAR